MISFSFDDDQSTVEVWSIGDQAPMPIRGLHVIKADVDGDELMMIENRFINLPRVKGSHITVWYGDHAKFIYGNLKG